MNTVLRDSLNVFGAGVIDALSGATYSAICTMMRDNSDPIVNVGEINVRATSIMADIWLRNSFRDAYRYVLLIECPMPAKVLESGSQYWRGTWENTVEGFIYLFLGLNSQDSAGVSNAYVEELLRRNSFLVYMKPPLMPLQQGAIKPRVEQQKPPSPHWRMVEI